MSTISQQHVHSSPTSMGNGPLLPVKTWPFPSKNECIFYHSIDLPGSEEIEGAWDIRGRFQEYIGNYSISGKTVLDVGTASGFLAFSAEQAGALVTAIDARDAREIRHIQFYDAPFHYSRSAWLADYDNFLMQLKNSFWYSKHRLQSNVEVVYAPLDYLPYWDRTWDVVLAGAIIEHLSDPVTAIGNIARLAEEAVIISFTPVEDTEEQIMRTANDWDSRQFCYTWWTLSRGLYKRVFDNLGFSTDFTSSTALVRQAGQIISVERPTIVASRRRPCGSSALAQGTTTELLNHLRR